MTDNLTTQSGAVYVKESNTVQPYIWGGRYMQLDPIVSSYGDTTITTSFDPRGGIEPDGTLVGEVSAPTSTITLKYKQYSKKKTTLLGRRHNIDRRMHIEGVDRDSPNKWIDIERCIGMRVGTRTTPQTVSTAEEEALITLPVTGLRTVDIYRVTANELSIANLAVPIVAVSVGTERNLRRQHSSVYAVTDINIAHPDIILLYNAQDGLGDDWVLKVLTGVADTPIDILGYGNFVAILIADQLHRSDDYGDSWSNVAPAEWATNNVTALFGVDQTLMFAVGENGFISRSTDGGRTWNTVVVPSTLTTNNLTGGKALNERVFVAYGLSGTLMYTLDGGESWSVASTTGFIGDVGVLDVHVSSRTGILIITDDGKMWLSENAAETVTEVVAPPGLPAGSYTHGVLVDNRNDVIFCLLTTSTNSYIYRTVDGEAPGYWYPVKGHNIAGGLLYTDLAMLGTNAAIAVGGNVAADDNLISNIL